MKTVLIILALWIGCLLPTEMFALIYWIIQPTSEMAKVALFGIGLWFGGILQLGLLVLGVCVSMIWVSDDMVIRRRNKRKKKLPQRGYNRDLRI